MERARSLLIREFRQIPEREKNTNQVYPNEASPARPTYEKLQDLLGGPESLEELLVFSAKVGGQAEAEHALEARGRKEVSRRLGEITLKGAKDKAGKELHAALVIRPKHHRAAEAPLPEPLVDERFEQYGQKKYTTVNVFLTLNIKGVGLLFPGGYESRKDEYRGREEEETVATQQSSKEYAWGYNVLGLVDSRMFNVLKDNTEALTRLGARVESIAAAYELKACFYRGELKTVGELKEMGVLPKDSKEKGKFKPLEIFRLQRVNTRFKDFCEASEEERKLMLQEAFGALNEEAAVLRKMSEESQDPAVKEIVLKQLEHLGGDYSVESSESVRRYLADSAHWIGKNLGILESAGRYMLYFNSGNVTLGAGELVDLDSVDVLKAKENINVPKVEAGEGTVYDVPPVILKDIRDSLFAFNMFLKKFEGLAKLDIENLRQELHDSFLKGHAEGFGASDKLEKMKFQNLKVDQFRPVVEDLARKIILENEHIAPVKIPGARD